VHIIKIQESCFFDTDKRNDYVKIGFITTLQNNDDPTKLTKEITNYITQDNGDLCQTELINLFNTPSLIFFKILFFW